MRHAWLALAMALLLSCATDRDVAVPHCAPLAELPPLAEPGCGEADPGIQRLSERIDALDSALLVRVRFDEDARPSLCSDHEDIANEWSMRREIGRAARSAGLERGPACLAGRRLDLNRREAALADLARAERRCAIQSAKPSLSAMEGTPPVASLRCVERFVDVLVLRVPAIGALVFGAPEVVDPPDLDAAETLERCDQAELDVEERVGCVLADGWELLQ